MAYEIKGGFNSANKEESLKKILAVCPTAFPGGQLPIGFSEVPAEEAAPTAVEAPKPVITEAPKPNKLTEKEITKLSKIEQMNLLIKLGMGKADVAKLKTEKARVDKILELQ